MNPPTWGELALSTLILSFVTGIALLFNYDLSKPYKSVVAIHSIYAYGYLLRSLHYYSSNLSLVFLALHAWKYFLKKYEVEVSLEYWFVGLLLFYIIVFEGFSGYVLRFDIEGFFAGRIASQIAGKIPVIGGFLSDFLFNSKAPVTFYFFHVIILPIFLLIFIYSHIRWQRYVTVEKFVIANILPVLFTIYPGLAPPLSHTLKIDPIKGPWFFLGIQELVYLLPPFWGGIVIPLVFFLLWLIFPFAGERGKNILRIVLIFLILTYALLTIEAYFFRGPGWRLTI